MDSVKIDRTKLKTIKSYAKLKGYTVQHIYNKVKNKDIDTIVIDGVTFIQV